MRCTKASGQPKPLNPSPWGAARLRPLYPRFKKYDIVFFTPPTPFFLVLSAPPHPRLRFLGVIRQRGKEGLLSNPRPPCSFKGRFVLCGLHPRASSPSHYKVILKILLSLVGSYTSPPARGRGRPSPRAVVAPPPFRRSGATPPLRGAFSFPHPPEKTHVYAS